MAIVFSQFDATPATVVGLLKTKILTHASWTNPSVNRVVCTTSRGAEMVIDLEAALATAARMQVTVYRTSGLADPLTRYIAWRSSGGATTDIIHCVLSVSKEHIFIRIQPPYTGETNGITSGSDVFFLGDMVPYYTALDTIPVVVSVASPTTSPGSNYKAYISRNIANTASWVSAELNTLAYPRNSIVGGPRRTAPDGKVVLGPYVVFADVEGMRGSLRSVFHADPGGSGTAVEVESAWNYYDYGSVRYVTLDAHVTTGSYTGAFGYSGSGEKNPVIAVPYADV